MCKTTQTGFKDEWSQKYELILASLHICVSAISARNVVKTSYRSSLRHYHLSPLLHLTTFFCAKGLFSSLKEGSAIFHFSLLRIWCYGVVLPLSSVEYLLLSFFFCWKDAWKAIESIKVKVKILVKMQGTLSFTGGTVDQLVEPLSLG